MTFTSGARRVVIVAPLLAALAVLLAAAAPGEARAGQAGTPNARIERAPTVSVEGTGAVFAFSSTEGRAVRYWCSLDGAPYRRCESPKAYGGLDGGRHRFRVRAVDAAGNVDRTPAARSWTVVEAPAPAVTIEGYHEYSYFRFSSDAAGSRFFCALDGGPFAPCASGDYRYVPYGEHTFSVYALGPDGARGETAVVEYESRDPNWD
jgi:large repetitive protein